MNGTNRTSRKKQSKQHRRSNRSNSQQAINGQLSKKQQAILNAPVKFGDEVLVTIHGIGSSGEGVGRVDDFTVFVPFALPGETVKVAIDMVKKTYATGPVSYTHLFSIAMLIEVLEGEDTLNQAENAGRRLTDAEMKAIRKHQDEQ